MNNSNGCQPWEHEISRRRMLGMTAGAATGLGVGGLGGLVQPAVTEELARNDRQILLVWLDGGMSQLESWDPKPNTQYGGPFRSIPTSIPGVHVSELMPWIAKLMHRLGVVRSRRPKIRIIPPAFPKSSADILKIVVLPTRTSVLPLPNC